MTVKKKQSYIVVLDWMVEKYHLKGNELLAYALIYGFSQDEESEYKGSYSYICKWLSIDRATAIRILNRLESKGLLTKRQELVGGKATNRYIAETPEAVVPVQTDPAEPENRPTPHPPDPSQNATGGEMSPVAKCDRYPSQNATQTRGKMPPSNTIGETYRGNLSIRARRGPRWIDGLAHPAGGCGSGLPPAAGDRYSGPESTIRACPAGGAAGQHRGYVQL